MFCESNLEFCVLRETVRDEMEVLDYFCENLGARETRKEIIESGEIPRKMKRGYRTYVLEDHDICKLSELFDACLARSQLKNKAKLAELTKISELLRK